MSPSAMRSTLIFPCISGVEDSTRERPIWVTSWQVLHTASVVVNAQSVRLTFTLICTVRVLASKRQSNHQSFHATHVIQCRITTASSETDKKEKDGLPVSSYSPIDADPFSLHSFYSIASNNYIPPAHLSWIDR